MKSNNKLYYIIALIVGLASFNQVNAQQKNELSIFAKGTISTLKYDLDGATTIQGDGGALGMSYSRYLSSNISIITGGSIQYYESGANFNTLSDSYMTTDLEGETFEFRYVAMNYVEQQRAYYANIPLQIQFETTGTGTRFYATVGAQAGFVLSAKYDGYYRSLRTSGFYQQYNAELFNPAFMGFVNQNNQDITEGDLQFKTAFSTIFEAGIKQVLTPKNSVYLGIYLDYGINNINKVEKDQNLIDYRTEEPDTFTFNSVFTSYNQNNATTYLNDIKPVSYGVKLRYGFDW